MLTAAELGRVEQASSGALGRWPATLHPDHAERCHLGARLASRTWVDGLFTRSGTPRWDRIRRCGDPVTTYRPADGAVSWQHRWCRDRACYACARSRSRRLAVELRAAADVRAAVEPLSFVTLTRRRLRGETAAEAWAAWQRCWVKLRHTQAWRDCVVGGLRAVEVTWSDGKHSRRLGQGWHVHAHCIIGTRGDERALCPTCDGSLRVRGLRCETCGSSTHRSDGTMLEALARLLRAWVDITHGSLAAQCAVPLDPRNVGQCSKYLTKLWELPPERARELFAAATGKRIFEAFGSWRSGPGRVAWRELGGRVEQTPQGWCSSGLTLRAIEALKPDTPVPFFALLPGVSLTPLRTGGLERKVWGLELARKRASVAKAVGAVPWVVERHDSGPAASRVAARAGTGARASSVATWRPSVVVATLTAGEILAALRADQRPTWQRSNAEGPAAAAARAVVAGALERAAREEYRGHVAHARANRRTWEY